MCASNNFSTKKNVQANDQKAFFWVYLVFICAITIVCQSNRNLGLSTFITLSVALQFLAFTLLALKVVKQKSASGISAKALICHAAVYSARLCTTSWLKGYIPVDPTGAWLYQLLDAMSFMMVAVLYYHVTRKYKATYQAEHDTFEVGYLFSGCFACAVIFHPHLNRRPVFDTLWAFSLYVDMVAMMPQLWMIAKVGVQSHVEALNAHYIAAMAASRSVSMYFWSVGYREFAPKSGAFNYDGWAVMAAQMIGAILMLDFLYFYFKAWLAASCDCKKCENGGPIKVNLDDLKLPGILELESAPPTKALMDDPRLKGEMELVSDVSAPSSNPVVEAKLKVTVEEMLEELEAAPAEIRV